MKKNVLMLVVLLGIGGFAKVDASTADKKEIIESDTGYDDNYKFVKKVSGLVVMSNSYACETHIGIYIYANAYYVRVSGYGHEFVRNNRGKEYKGHNVSYYKNYVNDPQGIRFFFNL